MLHSTPLGELVGVEVGGPDPAQEGLLTRDHPFGGCRQLGGDLDGNQEDSVLVGVEQVRVVPGLMRASPLDFVNYPISHSLLMAVVWGALIGGMYWMLRRDRRGGVVLGLLVVSHWLLDLPVHRPDLPLWPGSSVKVGLGAWNSIPLITCVRTRRRTRKTRSRSYHGNRAWNAFCRSTSRRPSSTTSSPTSVRGLARRTFGHSGCAV